MKEPAKTTIITSFYNKDSKQNESTAFVALGNGEVKIHKFIFTPKCDDSPKYMKDVDTVMGILRDIYGEVEMVDYHRGKTEIHYINHSM